MTAPQKTIPNHIYAIKQLFKISKDRIFT